MIILDEPTNHLDIESRDALVEALTEYGGAVILVSHDPHLVELVAERLWLVKDGRVTPFDDDMDAYRRMLLAERGGAPVRAREEKPKPRAPARAEVAPLRAEVARCEARVAQLEEMRGEIDGAARQPAHLFARRQRGDRAAAEEARRGRGRAGAGRGAVARRARAARGGGRAGLMSLEALVTTFVTLFVVIDPIAAGAALRRADPGDDRGAAPADRAPGDPASPSASSPSSGSPATRCSPAIGIGLPAFRISGGLLLFLIAVDMLFERRTERRERRTEAEDGPDPSVFPLAMPMIAGPGALATMILLSTQHEGEHARRSSR